MASDVLPSRNEANWGEREVYMRNYTKNPIPIDHNNTNNLPNFHRNPNPKPNPRLNPSPVISHGRKPIHEHAATRNSRPNSDPLPRVPLPSTVEFNRKPIAGINHKDAFHREYVTFNLALYTKNDIKELKKRLVSELEKVQSLLKRIEAREIESRPGFEAPRTNACDTVVAQPDSPSQKVEQHHLGSVFATTKGKNQSKTKKVLGQKRPNTNAIPSGRDVKRPAVLDAETSPIDKVVAAMMKKCKQILTKIMKNKAAWWFNTPVDVDGMKLFDYYQVIKNPMDLGSVKSKLEKNGYETPQSFAADVRLTFNNAMAYNPKGHAVHITAEKFLSMFEQMFGPQFKKFEAEYNRVIANVVHVGQTNVNQKTLSKSKPKPMPRALPEQLPVKNNAEQMTGQPALLSSSGGELAGVARMPRLGKLPKPKARDRNKRQMSYEEKQMLGVSLEELPEEKAGQMLHILRKRRHSLMQDGDGIELDIESLDNETLWELDRFVTHHKKVASKMKRQELIENMGSAGMVNKSPVHEAIQHGEEENNTGDLLEEDVDIGEEIPVGNFPPVEIEKDVAGASSRSSSSSSSGSGSDSSSSSGSDSGSSSGGDSGEDSVQSPYIESKEAQLV